MSTIRQAELPEFLFENAGCHPENAEPRLAPYATRNEKSRGRLHPEEERSLTGPFRRDCDRIIHSSAFRRLEYKTQVFVNHVGDHFRTRLTHTLEVAQIARSVSRNLALNEDLAEATALAHDLGHTPFGHAGERALNEASGGVYVFSHNAQSLKILTSLERRYAEFDGLNLTWETLEGVAKHNGPLVGAYSERPGASLPDNVAALNARFNLALDTFPSAEAQAAAISDDVAYIAHDVDDGLRAGLFSLDDLRTLPMVGNILKELENKYPHVERQRLIYETSRRMIHRMIVDITRNALQNVEKYKVSSPDDVRNLPTAMLAFSKSMEANVKEARTFLRERMYSHYEVCRMTSKASIIVKSLFTSFFMTPEILPEKWRKRAESAVNDKEKAVVAMDYISGMTDRYATDEYRKIFDPAFN
ncbi:MAG: deoxyguanosinetriphosphate triphosphohydrolase [Rickettsiales bacterium]